jgi:hypothetical protein
MEYSPITWLPFIDLLIILLCIKAVKMSNTVKGLIVYFTIAIAFIYLFASDLEALMPNGGMGFLFDWPLRGYVWRIMILTGITLSLILHDIGLNPQKRNKIHV